MIVKKRAKYAVKLVAVTPTCVMRIFLLRHGDISKRIQTVKCSLLDEKKNVYQSFYCIPANIFSVKCERLFVSKEPEFSKDFPRPSHYCRRFRKNSMITEDHFRRLPKIVEDFQRLPKLTEDVERLSKQGQRFPKDSHPISSIIKELRKCSDDFSNVKKKKKKRIFI